MGWAAPQTWAASSCRAGPSSAIRVAQGRAVQAPAQPVQWQQGCEGLSLMQARLLIASHLQLKL